MNTRATIASTELDWFTSSYSNNQGGNCVQGARLSDGGMAVRDSKNPAGPAFGFGPSAWTGFLAAVRSNDLA
ncbi:DUF397 domain-containing protein [Streptomyces profundus]|uniref:DUF397 domain-containing protein n=1 Tax=Streptomyces profundus TaxID=2867410 RepID=UPI001D15EB5F|nr:DUF397 domain-containing protein [Streptomyces sp. MA3_2.13]UED84878.1 DUF397 domain-containing protein [Streptomyces sp. MA3_2.13]